MPWIESRHDGGRCKECSARIYEGDLVWFAGNGEIYCEGCMPDVIDDDSAPKVDKDMPIE